MTKAEFLGLSNVAQNNQEWSEDVPSATPSASDIHQGSDQITDMPTQHSPQIAAIQANDIIMPHRLPHWYSGRGNVLGLIWA